MNHMATMPHCTANITALKAGISDLALSEILAFRLGAEEYGIDILRVQEIRSFERPTHMTNTPEHILGVVNLSGVIVLIVDMRIKLKASAVNYDSFTVVIVVYIGTRVVGMVVDGVSDVITPSPGATVPGARVAICNRQ